MRFIACSAGESAETNETLWALPTSSNGGTNTFVVAAMSSHTNTIGIDSQRMVRAILSTTEPSWT